MAGEKGDPVTGRIAKGTDLDKWWEAASWQGSSGGE